MYICQYNNILKKQNMGLVRLEVDKIQYNDTQTGAYILFLKEASSDRTIPIVIGGIEAHSIAIAMEDGIKPRRPLTHDLMKNLMTQYNIVLNKVIIDNFDEGIFYAKLVSIQNGKTVETDSRTSDAIALAVRFDVPIFCKSEILDETAIASGTPGIIEKEISDEEELMEVIQQALDTIVDEIDKPQEQISEKEKLSKELFGKKKIVITKADVQELLQTAIDEEQYERAAKLKRYLELM